ESFYAWRRFFEELADTRPAVLVFEDLHWADDDLLDFVDHLVDWTTDVPLLCVCTARPELLERRPAWGGGKPNAATISLSPLPDEQTARLIGALLERAVLPAEPQAARPARVEGESEYAFLHLLVRDVAYGQIPRAARSAKHQTVAEWMAALGGSEQHSEVLAHHYLQALEYAQSADAADPALEHAARRALRSA